MGFSCATQGVDGVAGLRVGALDMWIEREEQITVDALDMGVRVGVVG